MIFDIDIDQGNVRIWKYGILDKWNKLSLKPETIENITLSNGVTYRYFKPDGYKANIYKRFFAKIERMLKK